MLSAHSSCNPHPPFPEKDSLSPFPGSPQTHLEEYHHVYLQFLHLFSQECPAPATADRNDAVKQGPPRGRPRSKKDRHSKINTARGPRARRMRLSLDIARRFFDLQDLLGYDKPSRTVEWLLRNSGPAIDELARARKHVDNVNHPSSDSSACEQEREVASKNGRKSKARRQVGVGQRASVGRESRKKARERARERTSQKRRLFDQREAYYSQGFNDSCFGLQTTSWNPSTVFNFQEVDAVFFNQDEQIPDFQFSGKPSTALIYF